MEETDLQAQYEICKTRGHVPYDSTGIKIPFLQVCRYCHTYYKVVSVIEELQTPNDDKAALHEGS